MKIAKTALVAVLICAAAGGWARAEAGNGAKASVTLDIASQPLGDALDQFAQQTGLQVIYHSHVAKGLMAPRINGTLSPSVALERLLERTGLRFEYVDANTVGIYEEGKRSEMTSMRLGGRPEIKLASGAEEAASAEAQGKQGTEGSVAASEEAKLEEVVVTAQKREERLKDVPVSISVLAGRDLDSSTVTGVAEALNRVPGVSTTLAGQSAGTQIAMRGVTAGNALQSGSNPIGYYLDSAPFGLIKTAMVPDLNPYDLERVEVLRGPQGTLYGASAQNGVVRILTHDANLSELEFKARTSVSSTDGGGANYRADMAVNVPLLEGKLAARAVAGYEDWSGWISKPNDNNANDAQIRNLRLKLNGQPTDHFSIGASAWFSRSDLGAPPISANGTRSAASFDESVSTDYDVFGLKLAYDFAHFSVASMTSYLDFENRGNLDFFALGLFSLFTGLDSKVFSQEVNVNSTDRGPWRWSVGGIYRNGEDRLRQTLVPFCCINAPIDFYDRSKSFAMFGQVTRVFWEGKLELAAGVRHFEDDVTNGENIRNCGNVCPGTPLYRRTSTFNANSPRVALTWHPTEQSMIYASYAEGFRSGFNQNANAAVIPPLQADTLKNYELGTKGRAWKGRLDYDAAVYYIDWQDVQQSVGVLPAGGTTPVTALINGQSASGMGFEFALEWRPLAGLQLGAGLNWSDLKMDQNVLSSGILLFAAGDRLNFSPKYTANASVGYEFALGAAGHKGRVAVSGNYTSEQTMRVESNGALLLATGESILASRASLAIDSPHNWTVTLFVDNANNDTGPVTRSAFTPAWDVYTRPRTVGLQYEYRFARR